MGHIIARSIAALTVACLAFVGTAFADETCNSPYISKLIKGQEDYVYVWVLGVDGLGDGSDKLVTVDADPKSKSYGKVIHSVSTGGRVDAHRRLGCPAWRFGGGPRTRIGSVVGIGAVRVARGTAVAGSVIWLLG